MKVTAFIRKTSAKNNVTDLARQQPCDSGTEPAGQVAFGTDRQACREECHA